MRLVCVGLNWKTPVRIRERLAFEGPRLDEALGEWKAGHADADFAILSTCNRTELYAGDAAVEPTVGIEQLCEFLGNFHRLPLTDFYDHLYFHEDAGAALQLFKVASGLDSLVLGEVQIVGQVKEAYQSAVERQTAGPLTHALFQRALAVAKRVQNETALTKGRLSIASAAVDYIRGVFDWFDDKTVLVIGAGKMAELTLQHLAELKPGKLVVCNRGLDRARELADKFKGSVRPFEQLREALIEADIVISSTGAEEPIVKAKDFPSIMPARRNRLMAIVDIAVPRDFDPAIAELDNVWLWNIDDLEKVRYKTLRSRERELDHAIRIVEEEVESFRVSIAFQQTGPVIGRLEALTQQIIEQELARLVPRLNGMPEEHLQEIRQFGHRVKNKILHLPKAALREGAREGRHHGLLDALRKLFGLEES